MKRYIAVIELDDDEEIIDASVSYVYRSNGTNYSTTESVELKEESEGRSAIQINDFDTPIEVAQKIINGTMEVEANMVDKAMMRAFGGKEVDKIRRALFDLEELKEIAGYLLVYCNTHEPKDGNK
ncbi:MAG: hypothetical protein II453_07235 [Alphaproteobacteria bacterium]|nr:hypothetical protein [Alphaproteobacteria bacterium]